MSFGSAVRLRPKVAPSYVSSAENSITTGTSLAVTLPGSLTAGWKAIVATVTHSGAGVATPAGTWVQTVNAESSNTNATLRVWEYEIQGGDSGATKTFTLSGTTNQSACIVAAIYQDVGGFSVKPMIYTPLDVETQNSRSPRFPTVLCGPDDVVVAICGNYSYLSTAAAGAEVGTPPDNFTIRQTISRANNGLTLPRGCTIMDADGATVSGQYNDYEHTQDGYNVGVIFALSPVKPRWTHSMYVPTSLQGKPVVVYSTSSNAYVRAPEANSGYNTRTTWGDQIDLACGSSVNSRNFAMPGSYAEDICTGAYGSKSNYNTRATALDPMAISRAITFGGLPSTDIVALLDQIGNNIIGATDSAQVQTSMMNAVRSLIRRVRTGNGGAFITSQNGAITYTGSWSNGTSDGNTGGIYKQTTTPGDKAEYTINNVTGAPHEWEFVVVGFDSTVATGSTYDVHLDGVLYTSGTTHNQCKATGWGGGANYGFVQKTIPILIPTGSHTIRITHTGSSGHVLRNDSIQVGSLTPPVIVCNTLGIMPAAAYTTYPQLSLVKQNAYSDLLEAECASYADGRVLFYDPSASGVVNGQDAYFASDDVHQGETLMTNYAWEIVHDLLIPRVA